MKRFGMYALVAGLACTVMLGACSMSSETTTEISTTTDGKTTTTTTTTTSENGGASETTTDTSITIDLNDWTDAWMGSSDAGYDVFYAQAPEGTPQALLVIYDPNSETIESWLGDYEVPEQGYVVITDAGNGSSFGLTAVEEDAEHAILDLGEEYGMADLDVCEFPDFIQAIRQIDVNNQVLN